ncbi:MAG: TetR/AcrR family transcriptional regulator [Ferrimonas sp.]
MSKAALLKQREQRILAAALSAAREKGALDFRMADVARVAECSVGTLYGHFLSKEDMTAALVQSVIERHHLWLDEVDNLPLSYSEKVIVLLMSEWHRLAQDPVLTQLEMLTLYTELWQRVTEPCQHTLLAAKQHRPKCMLELLRKAAVEGVWQGDEERGHQLVESLCALLIGGQLRGAEYGAAPVAVWQKGTFLMQSLMLQLQAYGFAAPEADWQYRCIQALAHNPHLLTLFGVQDLAA